MLNDVPPERDTLAKADTQPKLFLFIPVELALAFIIAFFFIGSVFHIVWKHLVFIAPLWAGSAVLVRRDLNGVKVFNLKLKLILLFFDAYRWDGALSPSPSPDKSEGDRYAF